MNDPYPDSLDDMEFTPAEPGSGIGGQYLAALNRIATALERLGGFQPVSQGAVSTQNAPQQPRPALTPLPPVQQVQDRPACPYHGIEKVAASKQGPGFYCQAKGGPDVNAKGYCRWHS